MAYALINNGTVVAYPYTVSEFRQQNPNISLPQDPTEQQLNEVGIYLVIPTQTPSYNIITQNCNEGTPENVDGKWFQTWVVTDATPEEIALRESEAQQANKQQASTLLSKTDWTTIPDVGDPTKSDPYLSNVSDFVTYRNALRQIAVYPPITVSNWPSLPPEVWVAAPPVPEPVVTVEPVTV